MNEHSAPGSPDRDRPFGTDQDSDRDPTVDSAVEPDFDSDLNLALVHADDEYLDLLAGANLDDQDGVPDDQLSALLMTWRQDVEAEPVDELVDLKLATITVHAARARRRRRPRLLVPMAAAAAVLAIVFAGVGLLARDAVPGDTLWALTKVLYADHARSVEAAEEVRADLREAEAALTAGRVAEAKSKLQDAHAVLPTVSSEDGQEDLEQQHASLVAQLPGNPSDKASSPPSPNPTTAPGTDSGGPDSDESDSDTDPGTDESVLSTPPDDGEQLDPSSPPTTTTTPPSTHRSDSQDPGPGSSEDTPGDIDGGTEGGNEGLVPENTSTGPRTVAP